MRKTSMVTINRCFICAVLLLFANGAFSQGAIAIQSLHNFPDYVTQGTNYSLSAYVHNTGATVLTPADDISVEIEYNGGFTQTITNSYQVPAIIAPGDSFLWQDNYSFINGQLNTGINDILVWPELPNYTSDTAFKQIFYAGNDPALRVGNDLVSGMPANDEYDPSGIYTINVGAENVGARQTQNPTELYIQFENYPVVYQLGQLPSRIPPDFVETLNGQTINIANLLVQYWQGPALPAWFRIYGEEINGIPSAGSAIYTLSQGALVSDFSKDQEAWLNIELYPNPSKSALRLRLDPEAAREVERIKVFNALGQELLVIQDQASLDKLGQNGQLSLDISLLPPGTHLLELSGNGQKLARLFQKQ